MSHIDPTLVRPVSEQVAETARINELLRSEVERERARARRLSRQLRRISRRLRKCRADLLDKTYEGYGDAGYIAHLHEELVDLDLGIKREQSRRRYLARKAAHYRSLAASRERYIEMWESL